MTALYGLGEFIHEIFNQFCGSNNNKKVEFGAYAMLRVVAVLISVSVALGACGG